MMFFRSQSQTAVPPTKNMLIGKKSSHLPPAPQDPPTLTDIANATRYVHQVFEATKLERENGLSTLRISFALIPFRPNF